MRLIALTFLSLFIGSNAFAQTEKPINKTITDQFEKNYNQGDYEAIFSMLSPEMQKAMPAEQTVQFLTGLNNQVGKIVKREFIKYESTAASYKTSFEKQTFTVNISVDAQSKINGLFVKPFEENTTPVISRNTTKISLPFKEEWTVIWGGDTKELNYHVESPAQKNTFDLVITGEDGRSYKTDGKTNEDYYAFGKEVIAPCDAEVALVVDGIKDNKPGEMNPMYVPGNTVVLKTKNNEYLFLAHFKQHSIKVKQGQQVKKGDLLGLCGNSGNSSEAHIHFHLQNTDDMANGTGIKCYFDYLIVNGENKTDHSPIKSDKISPVKL